MPLIITSPSFCEQTWDCLSKVAFVPPVPGELTSLQIHFKRWETSEVISLKRNPADANLSLLFKSHSMTLYLLYLLHSIFCCTLNTAHAICSLQRWPGGFSARSFPEGIPPQRASSKMEASSQKGREYKLAAGVGTDLGIFFAFVN